MPPELPPATSTPARPPAARLAASPYLRLSLFYAAFLSVVGVLQPFWPLWLKARGLDPAEIGLVLAIGIGVKVVGLPIAAHAADRSGQRQRLMLALAAASLLSFALFGPAHGFWPIVLVNLLFFSLWPPVMSLAESLTLMAARDHGFEYGRVRLWGSIAYIATALLAGAILARVPADAVLWMVLACVALTVLACARLPDRRAQRSLSSSPPILDVLRSRPFALMVLACGLIQGSHAVYYAFGTIHWQRAGYGEALIGALWAEGVACEVALFAYSGAVLRRLGPGGLIMMAGLAAAVRWIGTGLTDWVPAIAALQTLHAFSFGAAHLSAMHWINRHVPPALSATAQSLYSGVVWGLFLGCALLAAGLLYESQASHAYLPMAIAALLGLAAAGPLWTAERRDPGRKDGVRKDDGPSL